MPLLDAPLLRPRMLARLERQLEHGCREIGADELLRPALVVAPHFDDETLGCGGTVAKKVRLGGSVVVVFLTDGAASHGHRVDRDRLRERRRNEALAAAAELGLAESSVFFGDLPDSALALHHASAVDLVASLIHDHRPLDLYVPHRGDGHTDHRAATIAALEAAAGGGPVADVFEYPVWHWQQWPWVRLSSPLKRRRWRPAELHGDAWRRSVAGRFGLRFATTLNRVVDVSVTLDRKLAALGCYGSQVDPIDDDGDWATLGDVSSGDFLHELQRDREFFRVRPVGHGAP